MGKVLLVCRLTVKDIRHRPVQALLLLLAIATAATTLTLGLALRGTTDNPYARTRAAANGPDVVGTEHGALVRRSAEADTGRLGPVRRGGRRGSVREHARSSRR